MWRQISLPVSIELKHLEKKAECLNEDRIMERAVKVGLREAGQGA